MGAGFPIEAERSLQPPFRKTVFFSHLILLAAIGSFAWRLDSLPDRPGLPRRTVAIHFEPVRLDAARFAPLRLAGAWRMTGDDSRFGGVSALAIDQAGLIALTDAGAVIRFARPSADSAAAQIIDLPSGPGRPGFKRNRDAEALVRDAAGRGWWVAFENHHQLWLYSPGFSRALGHIDFGRRRWPRNQGIEGMLAAPGELTVLPEAGGEVIRLQRAGETRSLIRNPVGRISDAARLPGGHILLLARKPTVSGFHNALVPLLPGDQLGKPIVLGLGALDNAEAIAVEPISGRTRLWLMTDDNFRWPMRTLLVALDLPGAAPNVKN